MIRAVNESTRSTSDHGAECTDRGPYRVSSRDNSRTVERGGAGLYWETERLWRRLRERAAIGPSATGVFRCRTPASSTFSRHHQSQHGPAGPIGASLPASGQPTNLTVGQFMQSYNAQIGALQAQLAPTDLNDLSIRKGRLRLVAERIDRFEEAEAVKVGVAGTDSANAVLAHQHGRLHVVGNIAREAGDLRDDISEHERVPF